MSDKSTTNTPPEKLMLAITPKTIKKIENKIKHINNPFFCFIEFEIEFKIFLILINMKNLTFLVITNYLLSS